MYMKITEQSTTNNCTIQILNDRFMKLNYCHAADAQWYICSTVNTLHSVRT